MSCLRSRSADENPWLAAKSFSLFSHGLENPCYFVLSVKEMELDLPDCVEVFFIFEVKSYQSIIKFTCTPGNQGMASLLRLNIVKPTSHPSFSSNCGCLLTQSRSQTETFTLLHILCLLRAMFTHLPPFWRG